MFSGGLFVQGKPLSAPLARVWFHTRKVPTDQHRFDMHLFGILQEGQTYRLESRASRVDRPASRKPRPKVGELHTLGAYEAAFYALVKENPQIVLANGGKDEALE